jgi:hypothetical protein
MKNLVLRFNIQDGRIAIVPLFAEKALGGLPPNDEKTASDWRLGSGLITGAGQAVPPRQVSLLMLENVEYRILR